MMFGPLSRMRRGRLNETEQSTTSLAAAAEPEQPADEQPPKNLLLRGIAAAPGVAVGPARVVNRPLLRADTLRRIAPAEIASESDRLLRAIDAAKDELRETRQRLGPVAPEQHLAILSAYIEMVGDEALLGEALLRIERELMSAEAALARALAIVRRALANADDPYLSARAADLGFVEQQILNHLRGGPRDPVAGADHPAVVVARHLSPADAVQLERAVSLAIATDVGGGTSHTAIVARSLGIPAVVGLQRLSAEVEEGDLVIVDGLEGLVIVDPSPEVRTRYEERLRGLRDDDALLLPHARVPAVTADGVAITVRANIERLDDVAPAVARGGEGVGLYRTEFIYLGHARLPSEEEHYQAYRLAVERTAPHPVTIRTLDLGGDKLPAAFHRADAATRAWSVRGIRLSLAQQQIFKQQLRGVIRASAHGPVRLLFPMVSGPDEVRQARQVLDEVYAELRGEGHTFDPAIPVGVMVEVPAAAATADLLASQVDFFSIGTNDLIHYTLAIDRGDERAAHLYQPLHPAVIRLVRQVAEAGQSAGIPVAVCGEMARDDLGLMVLLGLGLREFSVNGMAIPQVKARLRKLHTGRARELAERIGECQSVEEALVLARQALAAADAGTGEAEAVARA